MISHKDSFLTQRHEITQKWPMEKINTGDKALSWLCCLISRLFPLSKKNPHLVSMTNFKKHVTLTSSAMDATVVEFWKQRAEWWIHSTVLTCHLQACILVDWPSVVKWGVMSGRYLYIASRSSLMWIYNTNRHFRTSKILEHMQWHAHALLCAIFFQEFKQWYSELCTLVL